jgi:hypothetical protein
MKTVGQHDFSKQEYFHVLNGFEFVEMSKTIVKVNVMGTRRLRAPSATDTDATYLTEKNKAGYYWNRENSEGVLKERVNHDIALSSGKTRLTGRRGVQLTPPISCSYEYTV